MYFQAFTLPLLFFSVVTSTPVVTQRSVEPDPLALCPVASFISCWSEYMSSLSFGVLFDQYAVASQDEELTLALKDLENKGLQAEPHRNEQLLAPPVSKLNSSLKIPTCMEDAERFPDAYMNHMYRYNIRRFKEITEEYLNLKAKRDGLVRYALYRIQSMTAAA